jgi:hypothetical protein
MERKVCSIFVPTPQSPSVEVINIIVLYSTFSSLFEQLPKEESILDSVMQKWSDMSSMLVNLNSYLFLLVQHLGSLIQLAPYCTSGTSRSLSISSDLWWVSSSHGSETQRPPPTSCTSHRVNCQKQALQPSSSTPDIRDPR